MAEKSWLKKIAALKRLLREVGPLWPSPSTKLSGYGESGPYHCEDCVFLKKDFKDEDGNGRCNHPVVISDSEVKHDDRGLGIVNIERGCCEFVEPPKEKENGEETP
jgi:hypothetical protein